MTEFVSFTNERTPDFDGLLWQPTWGATLPRRRQVAADILAEPAHASALPLQADQEWVELDWKEAHGSQSMLDRLASKLDEEMTGEALVEYYKLRPGEQREPAAKLMDELGDVRWCSVAVLSNAGRNLATAVIDRLRAQGIFIAEGYDLNVGDIDKLMEHGFVPSLMSAPLFDHYEDDPLRDYDDLEPEVNWRLIGSGLKLVAQGLQRYKNKGTASEYSEVLGPQALDSIAADAYIFTAYSARRWAGSSLADVIVMNMSKITDRVNSNSIDRER